MPIGTPHTWASAEALTSAVMKSEIEDQFTALWSPPRARLYAVNNVSINSQTTGTLHTTAGAGSLITFFAELVETYTGTSMLSGSAGVRDGLIAPVAGIYEVYGEFCFPPHATGQRAAVLKQNTTFVDVDCKLPSPTSGALWGPGSDIGCTSMQVSAELKMAVNDKVQIFGTHNAGTALVLENFWGCLELNWIGNTA